MASTKSWFQKCWPILRVLNGKDVPYLVSMTQPLLGKEKLKNQMDLTSSEVSTT